MANVTWTVPNKNGSYDGDMVVKQFTSLTINTGDTVTVDQPCRGLMILVQGNCTINGTLSMASRGPYANPTASGANDANAVSTSGLQFPFLTSGGSSSLTAAAALLNGCGTTARSVISNFVTINSNGVIKTLVRQGANGGGDTANNTSAVTRADGNDGSAGSTGQTGGGGSGSEGYNGQGKAGSYGSCWGGGSGGGSENNMGGATAATAWGGPGGVGESLHNAFAGNGAGNPLPASTEWDGDGQSSYGGSTRNLTGGGTGGTIILIVGGNLTIGASGVITAAGGNANDVICTNSVDWISTGAGAGGGNILVAYRGTYTNNGSVTAAGGRGGNHYYPNVNTLINSKASPDGNGKNSIGGNGGAGSVQVFQIR